MNNLTFPGQKSWGEIYTCIARRMGNGQKVHSATLCLDQPLNQNGKYFGLPFHEYILGPEIQGITWCCSGVKTIFPCRNSDKLALVAFMEFGNELSLQMKPCLKFQPGNQVLVGLVPDKL